MPLELEPAESVFIVFRKKDLKDKYRAVLKEGKELISIQNYNPAKPAHYANVQNNFTVTLWAKPDTFAQTGRSMLFHPPEGEVVYGSGHVACGLGAGQNGIRVYERGRGNAKVVLEAIQSLEGWTHLALVYEEQKPLLYINGKLAATGKSSGNIVHPGLGTTPAQEQSSTYFEGNYTAPDLHLMTVSAETINEMYKKGLPAPSMPSPVKIQSNNEGKLKVLFLENGKYTLEGKTSRKLGIIKDCSVTNVSGAWRVQFPKGSKTPAQITLPSLVPLHKYADFNVKHFSGTATYLKTISVSAIDLLPGKKLLLDLGRVEVIAEVKVNGRMLGNLWKEPSMVDITKAVRVGINQLEIEVTNLWANRLIGDEYLPVEKEYSKDHFIKKLPDWYVNNKPKPVSG